MSYRKSYGLRLMDGLLLVGIGAGAIRAMQMVADKWGPDPLWWLMMFTGGLSLFMIGWRARPR